MSEADGGAHPWTDVYLAVGSNLGDRRANIERAIERLRQHPEIDRVRVSSIIETDPVGGPPQGRYLNGAVAARTRLNPDDLLRYLQDVEHALGRVRSVRNGPRELDLDVLIYGTLIRDDAVLQIPHPRMLEREFVLAPLCELAPSLIHPRTGKPIASHLDDLRAGSRGAEGARS
jgi:2-amino-4-hydroxy-6-hydroxymethyldihydropteridine diphosphokinase